MEKPRFTTSICYWKFILSLNWRKLIITPLFIAFSPGIPRICYLYSHFFMHSRIITADMTPPSDPPCPPSEANPGSS